MHATCTLHANLILQIPYVTECKKSEFGIFGNTFPHVTGQTRRSGPNTGLVMLGRCPVGPLEPIGGGSCSFGLSFGKSDRIIYQTQFPCVARFSDFGINRENTRRRLVSMLYFWLVSNCESPAIIYDANSRRSPILLTNLFTDRRSQIQIIQSRLLVNCVLRVHWTLQMA